MNESHTIKTIEKPPFELLTVSKYLTLCFFSLGFYHIWWMFKAWCFFRNKESLNIIPGFRAITAMFFLPFLFVKIQRFAAQQGYTKYFSTGGFFMLYLLFVISSQLPGFYSMIWIFASLHLIPAMKALNFAILSSNQYSVNESPEYNKKQITILITGGLFWLLFLMVIMTQL